MRGGRVVSGDAAQAIRELPIMSGQDVVDGGFVALPTCKSADDLANPRAPWSKAGRPCPYAPLSPENETAADVVVYARSEHTRGLASEYAREAAALMPSDDRAPFIERILAALSSKTVVDELYPPMPEAPANG